MSSRELDLRRPRDWIVNGGRTLVEDARCLAGGGARVAMSDKIQRAEERKEERGIREETEGLNPEKRV